MKRMLKILVLAVLVPVPVLAQEGAPAPADAPKEGPAEAPKVTVAVPAPVPAPVPATAQAKGFGIGNRYAQFTGRMQSLFLWRNDSDFDRTAPYYDANGQDIGVFGTFLAPMLVVTPVRQLKLVFEMEMGLNIWSMQDADTYGAASPSWFRMAIRQAYTEGNFLHDHLGFRVGYEQLFDPTGLFVGHWLGAANAWAKGDWGQLTLTVAQMPDQTYEGVAFDSNNFNSDSILYGLRLKMPFDRLALDAAVWGLHDTQVVGQKTDLMAVTASLSGNWDWVRFGIDGGLQYGVTRNRAAGRDETTLAWAAQGFLDIDKPLPAAGDLRLQFHLNTMALSGDDEFDGNTSNHAWFYSGKSRSRTMLLTEDEIRDRGGNFDESMSERRQGDGGKYYLNRAGLSVTDATLGVQVKDWFRPSLTVGAGFALNPENALGSRFVGLEADLRLTFLYSKYLAFDVVGSYLLPGEAGAAFVNRTGNRAATDDVYQFETSLTAYF